MSQMMFPLRYIKKPSKARAPRRVWEMGYTEVRRTLVDVDRNSRKPVLEDLFPDIVRRQPPVPPEPKDPPIARLIWRELYGAPPELSELFHPDLEIGERYIRAVKAAILRGEPVPPEIMAQVMTLEKETAFREIDGKGKKNKPVNERRLVALLDSVHRERANADEAEKAVVEEKIIGLLTKVAEGDDDDLAQEAREALSILGADAGNTAKPK